MAFENVFGNVDFGAPQRQANIEQQQFAQMLGQGIQAAQENRRMDVQERQLEAKANQFNLKRTAENALLKKNMGMELTPQEQAAVQTMGQIAPPTYATDAYGNTVMRPSGWASMGGGQQSLGQRPAGMGTPFNPDPAQQPRFDRQLDSMMGDLPPAPQGAPRLSLDDLQGINIPQMNASQVVGYNEPQAVVSDGVSPIQDSIPTYQAPSRFGAKGEIMSEESKQKLSDKQAEMLMQERFEESKELKNLPAKERSIVESVYKWNTTEKTLDDAIKSVDNLSAGLGSVTSIIPATPARNLSAKLDTVKADAAFGTLQAMRQASKTGGALGAVSERELDLLMSAQAPLDQAQSPSQLKEALNIYKDQRRESLKRVADAFEQDYGYRPKTFDNILKKNKSQDSSTGGWSIKQK